MKNLNIPDNRIEICGINLNNVCPPLKIIACYKTPGFTFSQDQWEQIKRHGSVSRQVYSYMRSARRTVSLLRHDPLSKTLRLSNLNNG